MKLYCVHCGTYELTPEQEADARRRISYYMLVGIICYRCDEEAKIVDRPPRLYNLP